MAIASREGVDKRPSLSRTQVSPHGVPPVFTLGLYLFAYLWAGGVTGNVIPTVELLKSAGVLASTGMTEAQIHDTLVTYLNYSISISLFSSVILQFMCEFLGGIQLLAVIWFFNIVTGFLLAFFADSQSLVFIGILLACLAFPTANQVLPAFYGMFPGIEFTVCAMASASGDFAYGICGALQAAAVYFSVTTNTVIIYYLGIYAPIGLGIILTAPRWGTKDWLKYIPARKYNKNLMTYTEYQETIGQGKASRATVLGYNPSTDPLYHSYNFASALLTPHLWVFMTFFIPHFLRVKKIINPFIDKILIAKGIEFGIPQEEVDAMLGIFYAMPAFGWIPAFVMGVIADAIGNVSMICVMNVCLAIGYMALAYGPWSKPILYFVCLCYTTNSGCCFGLGISYFQELFGARLIGTMTAFFSLAGGLFGIVCDYILPRVIETWFHGDAKGYTTINTVFTLISLGASFVLRAYPPPGPPGPRPNDRLEMGGC